MTREHRIVLTLAVCFSATFTFTRPLQAATIERVSIASNGSEGDGGSFSSVMSADGRFVAFASSATNLVPDDTNGVTDIFVHDRLTETTERISVYTSGEQMGLDALAPAISADGRFVAFMVSYDHQAYSYVYVRDRALGTTEMAASPGDICDFPALTVYAPSISGDGRFVAFGGSCCVWLHPETGECLQSSTVIRVRDMLTGAVETLPLFGAYPLANPVISADGRFVVYTELDSAYVNQIWVYDRVNRTSEALSISSTGEPGNHESADPSISADGQFVGFESQATNLVPGDANVGWDVFVRDRLAQTTELVSVSTAGAQANGDSGRPGRIVVNADGRFVAFSSSATNLVPGDTNGTSDVFLRDRQARTTEMLSVSNSGQQGNGPAWSDHISADGRYIAFSSGATNLVSGDTNGETDVFVVDRLETAPQTEIVQGPCEQVLCPGEVRICWAGSDNETPAESLQYFWGMDGRFWQGPISETCVTLSGLSDGQHLFEVKARDLSGNEDPTPAQCSFTVDAVPPTVSVTLPASTATVKGIVTISATASDPGSIQRVEFYVRGELLCSDTTLPYSCDWDTRPLSVQDGPAEICVKAFDLCDRSSQQCIAITVDNTTFDDVAKTSPFWRYVEALASRGITSGCSASPPLYCPYGNISRAQMAVLLCRAAGKGPLDRQTPTFCDVPKTNPYYGWIERIADANSWNGNPPTIGCNPFPCRQYCPSRSVTRDEMAAFLVRATGKLPMGSCSGVFSDVDRGGWACPYIERIADAASWPGGVAVTNGCVVNPLRYCPTSPVTRGQMAVFLVRALGLTY